MDKKYDGVIEMRFLPRNGRTIAQKLYHKEIHVFPRLYRRPKINCRTIS